MNNIQKFRKEQGISQLEFAAMLEMTRPGLSYVEHSNARFIKEEKLKKMSDILNISIVKLLGMDNLKYLPTTIEDIDFMIEMLEQLKMGEK